MSPKNQKALRLLGVPCILIGVVLLSIGLSELFQGLRSEKWPQTEGVVFASKVGEHVTHYRHHSTYYRAEVSYRYKVAGVSYVSDRVDMPGLEPSKEDAQWLVDRYPPGRKVAVFYAPDNPTTATLHPGLSSGAGFELAFGILGIVFGLGLIFVTKHLRRELADL